MLLFLLLVFAGCRKSGSEIEDSRYHEEYNLAYGSYSLQRYDLFLPGGRDQQTKMILLLHGGGWATGDKWDCGEYAKKFAEYGFAAASMNYRLANDSIHYPEMLADIDSMICCISENAGKWGIGGGRVALFGYSAGGHLALLYAYARDKGQKVGAVVSLAGPADLQDSTLWSNAALFGQIKLMTGDTVPANWSPANPARFISAADPPTFLIHGTNDGVVPASQSVRLSHLLRTSNGRVSLMLLENETHAFSFHYAHCRPSHPLPFLTGPG